MTDNLPDGQSAPLHGVEAETSPAPLEIPTGQDLQALIEKTLDDGKAEDILLIDLRGKSSFTEAMIIATGRSNRQVAALSDQLIRAGKAVGLGKVNVEGLPQADWVLIDFNEVIVHVFRPEVRDFYNLEKMWGAERPAKSPDPAAADPI